MCYIIQLKWAISGRNGPKLEAIKAGLGRNKPDVVVVSLDNTKELNALIKKTSVVMTLAGPFTLFGDPIAKACVENGTDYCDITGNNRFKLAHLYMILIICE